MKYIVLMVGSAYVLSIGSVYAQTNQTNQTNQDVTGPILAQALKSLMNAKQAYDSGNKTGALDEAHHAMWYLQMIGLPKNCIIDNNQMLQCNFPK
jgi:DNA-binding MurR/RpiR family transcriptional regulator